MPVLVAPDAFSATLRAPVVAAAIGRGLERAGVSPLPELCPLAGGGRGTIEVLLPVLGGETGDGFALVEDGGTAIVELGATPEETARRLVAAAAADAEVVLVCAGGASAFDGGAGVVEAIEESGGLRGAALVVLCETRASWGARPADDATAQGALVAAAAARLRRDPRGVAMTAAAAARVRRDPRGVAMTAAGGGLAGALWARYDAALVPGPAFVLEQLGFDARMRAARAVVVGEARLERATLAGRVAGEAAIRARQAGVPCHAVVAASAIDGFDARILDVQAILEATTIAELEAAGERLATFI